MFKYPQQFQKRKVFEVITRPCLVTKEPGSKAATTFSLDLSFLVFGRILTLLRKITINTKHPGNWGCQKNKVFYIWRNVKENKNSWKCITLKIFVGLDLWSNWTLVQKDFYMEKTHQENWVQRYKNPNILKLLLIRIWLDKNLFKSYIKRAKDWNLRQIKR